MNRRIFLMCAGSAVACTRDSRPRLNVFNWSTYIDPAMVERFEHERGVRIRYGTYESNEEMLARAITGNSGWDVVFPTHSRLTPMFDNGLLATLDHRRLPALNNLDSVFRAPVWDRDLRLGVPYMWNATGIVYNRDQVAEPTTWSALWDAKYSGRITMLDDVEDVLGACLLKLGFDFSSTRDNELNAAREQAIEQKKLVRAYINAEVRDQLVAGDVLEAMLWSTTASQAIHGGGGRLGFTYPREGYPLYCDCAAILRESSRYELAHEFLNFLLDPAVAATNAKVAESATANGPARAMLPEDPVLYPPKQTFDRGIWPPPLNTAAQRVRDRLWTEIKSA